MLAGIDPTLDMRLLHTTHMILREWSVTRVAAQLGHSQPAISASLKRARSVFGDPLLVRSGHEMVLTDGGAEVLQAIEQVLANLKGVLGPERRFDPATTRQSIRICAINCFSAMLVPQIGAALRREAPLARVDFVATSGFDDLPQALGAGDVDLAIANWPNPRENLRASTLLDCDIACLTHRDHPLANRREIGMDDYLGADHLSPTPAADALHSPIDGRLRALGHRRRIVMTAPEFGLVPGLLRGTGLIFTSARACVAHLAAMPGNEDLRVTPAPGAFGRMTLYLLWHERMQTSRANRWLRALVRRAADRSDVAFDAAPSSCVRDGAPA